MIWKITQKEWKELFREGRFKVILSVLLVLLIAAVLISKNYYEYVNEQHRQAQERDRAVWLNQGEKNPHSAAHYGVYVFKPKYPLALIDQGVNKYAGISVFLEAHARNETEFIAAQDQTGIARFGELTPDFILLFLLPLFIILIGYNSFSREKESGTLRMLKGQGVSSWKIAAGKWLGIFAPVFFVLVLLFATAGILLSNLEDFGRFDMASLGWLFLVYTLYSVIFINLVLIVSAWVIRSNLALVGMIGIWILAVLALPRLATNLADYLYPYPGQQEFQQQIANDISKGLSAFEPWNEASLKLKESTLLEYGVETVEELPFNYDGYSMQKSEEYEAAVYFHHHEKLKEQYQNQARIYQAGAVLSPFLPVRFLSMGLARTDYNAHWNFNDEAEKHRLRMVEILNRDMIEHSLTGDWAYSTDQELWKEIPEFSYEYPNTASVITQNGLNLFILAGWLFLSFVILVWRAERI